jgi:type II secretory pathway component GspD/PulD (secretin)
MSLGASKVKRKQDIIPAILAAAALWTLPVAVAQPMAPRAHPIGKLSLQNTSLTEVIAQLARQLNVNYTLDPAVKDRMIFSTYGDTSRVDARTLLDLILRINGATLVEKADGYRIVPATDPLPPHRIQENDQPMLNLIVPKYVTVDEIVKGLDQGESATIYTYPAANLLFILDGRRNMRRIMDSVALFDSDRPVPQPRPNPVSAAARLTVISLAKAPDAVGSLLGADMGGGFHGCVAGDNSPDGTVKDGFKKVMRQSPFGQTCHWEQVK